MNLADDLCDTGGHLSGSMQEVAVVQSHAEDVRDWFPRREVIEEQFPWVSKTQREKGHIHNLDHKLVCEPVFESARTLMKVLQVY